MFNREALLEAIWQEKRGKIVRPDIYPLGININLDSREFHWHELVYAILSCLRADPARALDWARNWGRCLVLVHPKRGFSVVFNTRMSDDELLGRFVMTSQDIDPAQILSTQHNQGAFRALLNKSYPLKLEGAVIQVERMVDETVWCEFLRIAVSQQNEVTAYAKALDHVWEFGVRFEYASEDEILRLRESDSRWAVRVYGDILGHQIVPRVIGAVDPECRIHDSKRLDADIAPGSNQPAGSSHVVAALPETGTCVPMVGITLAKPIHFGHVLTITLADLIRRGMDCSVPVYLESNDMGRRIDGLIVRLCELRQTTVEAVLRALIAGTITPDEIATAYRERSNRGAFTHQTKELLDPTEPILRVMENQTIQSLQAIGLSDIRVVSERRCRSQYLLLANFADKIGTGFKVVRVQRGKHQRLIVVEREGAPTASASRAAFVIKAIEEVGANNLPVYVDRDESVAEAVDLLNVFHQQPLVQFEGCGLGFSMAIGSGSEGNIPTIEDLARYGDGRDIRPQLTFFLLTRNATAPAQIAAGTELSFARTEPVGASWFDYKNEESLWLDWYRAKQGLQHFRRQVDRLREVLSSRSDSHKSESITNPRFKNLIGRIKLAAGRPTLKQVFPGPTVLRLDSLFSRVRQWCCQQGIALPAVDEVIVRACLDSDATLAPVVGQLSDIQPRLRQLPWPTSTTLKCVFVSSALERGYVGPEAERIAKQYLNGQFCLIRKRCLCFDILRESIELAPALSTVGQSLAKTILDGISLCQSRLGFD